MDRLLLIFGGHIHKVLFTDHRFHDEPEVFGNGITQRFPYDLAGILNRKLDF